MASQCNQLIGPQCSAAARLGSLLALHPRNYKQASAGTLLGGPRFENAMNAADTAWRRPPRPPRPRFLASSILPALTIFLTAILQISASNLLHEHENRNSNLYCNKTLVSTSQCSLRTKIPLCHNGTHASSQLRALTPPEHFSTPLLETLPTTLHEKSFMRLPACWPLHALAQHTDARTFLQHTTIAPTGPRKWGLHMRTASSSVQRPCPGVGT